MQTIDLLLAQLRDESCWSSWQEMEGCRRGPGIPNQPGLYRLGLVTLGAQEVVYIGQSGDLRVRLGMLGGIVAPEMPYRSPHVAGPPLWALRDHLHRSGVAEVRFEISFLPLSVPKPVRLGLECVAIALYRQLHQHSPRANWGRMPVGYKASSLNTAQLVARGRRFRGGGDQPKSMKATNPELHLLGRSLVTPRDEPGAGTGGQRGTPSGRRPWRSRREAFTACAFVTRLICSTWATANFAIGSSLTSPWWALSAPGSRANGSSTSTSNSPAISLPPICSKHSPFRAGSLSLPTAQNRVVMP